MERDFRYLRDRHTDAGARNIFEDICTELLKYKFEDAFGVRVSQGDEGIDIFVRDMDLEIDVYQCKYFIDGIGDAQKSQIRESFKRAVNSDDYKMKKWYLCVPCVLSAKEHMWWAGWKRKQESTYDIKILLYDGATLLKELKQYNMYNRLFDNDIIILLEEILKNLDEQKRYYEEILYDLEDIEDILDEIEDIDGFVFVKKLRDANILEIDECINEFFNAEIIKESIESKKEQNDIKAYKNLEKKVRTVWNTQFMMYAKDTDGLQVLVNTYERIEDLDTGALSAPNEISLIAKKGILHQLAEQCKVGWVKNYADRLIEN